MRAWAAVELKVNGLAENIGAAYVKVDKAFVAPRTISLHLVAGYVQV